MEQICCGSTNGATFYWVADHSGYLIAADGFPAIKVGYLACDGYLLRITLPKDRRGVVARHGRLRVRTVRDILVEALKLAMKHPKLSRQAFRIDMRNAAKKVRFIFENIPASICPVPEPTHQVAMKEHPVGAFQGGIPETVIRVAVEGSIKGVPFTPGTNFKQWCEKLAVCETKQAHIDQFTAKLRDFIDPSWRWNPTLEILVTGSSDRDTTQRVAIDVDISVFASTHLQEKALRSKFEASMTGWMILPTGATDERLIKVCYKDHPEIWAEVLIIPDPVEFMELKQRVTNLKRTQQQYPDSVTIALGLKRMRDLWRSEVKAYQTDKRIPPSIVCELAAAAAVEELWKNYFTSPLFHKPSMPNDLCSSFRRALEIIADYPNHAIYKTGLSKIPNIAWAMALAKETARQMPH